MKSKPVLLLIALFFSCHSQAATSLTASQGPPSPTLVGLTAHHVFAPPGFDDNDDVQIVIESELPNTCYKSAMPLVTIDPRNFRIYLQDRAYLYSGMTCLELWAPATRVVDLGILPRGNYSIVELGANGAMNARAQLPVAAAPTSSKDDYLYAPVQQAYVDKSAGKAVLNLSGTFPSGCMTLPAPIVLHRVSDVIEVLPIVNYAPGAGCDAGPVPFAAKIELPSDASGTVLLHIRSMGGQAVNLVADLIF